MKRILIVGLLLGMLLAACGPQATPTADPAAIQATAVSMAFTMAAQTMAAIPTATPLPPTPLPTSTLPPTAALPAFPTLPTMAVIPTPTTASASGDPCNSLMDPNPGGPKTYLIIDNRTKGWLSMSLWLSPTAFACGYARLPAIGASASVGVTLPDGCYYPSAYVNDPKKPRSLSGPSFCIHGGDKVTLTVTYEGFKTVYP